MSKKIPGSPARVYARIAKVAGAVSLAALLSGTALADDAKLDGTGIKMGLFGVGSANAYQRANIEGAKAAAEKYGVDLTVYTGDLDVQVQKQQFDLALDRKLYDVFVTALMSGDQLCNTIKKAVKENVKVVLYVTTACGGVPDGVTTLVNLMTPEAFRLWWDYIFTTNEPQEFAMLALDPNVDLTRINKTQMEEAMAAHPGFKLVSYQNTNDTVPGAYQMAQDMLRAHPDVKIIGSASGTITQGIVQAVKAAGKEGQIKVYDFLGNKFTLDAVKSGAVTASMPGLPYTEAYIAVESGIRAMKGESVPKMINPAESLKINNGPIITKENVDQFKPEY